MYVYTYAGMHVCYQAAGEHHHINEGESEGEGHDEGDSEGG